MGIRKRVLIVDDDAVVRASLCAALSPPYEVETAETGGEALMRVSSHPPDLLLLDYVLHDLSGLAVLQKIAPIHPTLPVILITGFSSEDLAVGALRAGARDYLKKPIRLAELRTRVANLLTADHDAAHPPEQSEAAEAPPTAPDDTRLKRALDFIDAQLHTDLRLEHVAREGGMSKYHFCRHFKESLGLTFRQFLSRRRIARAIALLRTGTQRVSDISLDVGFKDLSHFSRVFHKLTGQPPSRFRRTLAPLDDADTTAGMSAQEKQERSNK